MKNIAVLIYDLTVEYHLSVVEGITTFFQDKKDVNVLFLPVNAPHATTYEFDYQYWTTVELVKSKQIDSVIVVTNSFLNLITIKQLTDELKKLSSKPIISIATPLKLPQCSYTYTKSKKAYEQIIAHLVEKHNRSKIAYFDASLTNTPDSVERVDSYKKALIANGLEVNEALIFPGDFTPSTSYDCVINLYKAQKKIPFDAVLCANDYMAYGTIFALQKLGIQVPEEVCVVGCDDASIAVSSFPTISTINQNVSQSGYKAAEMAYKAAIGEPYSKKVLINSTPVFRQSCGCIPKNDYSDSFYDQKGILHECKHIKDNILNLFGNALDDMATIYHMLNMTETIETIDDYYGSLVKTLRRLYFNFFAICLYENEIVLDPEDDFVLPEEARLMFLYDFINGECKNYNKEGGIAFNPAESLLPKDTKGFTHGNYYIIPVSMHKKNYGYMVCRIPLDKYTFYEVFIKIILNAFVHSYEYSKRESIKDKLVEKNIDLEQISKTDELTKLLNRRGFMESSQNILDFSEILNTSGAVIFFDLDGLKKINDKWGHNVGDTALQTVADVFKIVFRKTDIVGRLSGDEFAALVPSFEKNGEILLRKRINDLCEELSKSRNLPFVVSISMGIVEYNSKNRDLQILLSMADKELYKEKEIKHSLDKKNSKEKV